LKAKVISFIVKTQEIILKKNDNMNKSFGLIWEDKKEDVAEECKDHYHYFIDDESKCINIDSDGPTNIIIQSDNYHALSILSCTHRNKIDIIYIDPPYNNGKKDWKYNNNYVDANDCYRHSKWLSFMNRRLILAKELLADDGVLICTIDRHETARLSLLLEQIFPGKEVSRVTIEHNPRGVQGDNFSHTNEDAYFVYPSGGKYIGKRKRESDNGLSNLRNWGGESSRSDGKNCFYPIYFKDGKISEIGNSPDDDFHPTSACIEHGDGTLEFWPIDNKGIEKKWRYAGESLLEVSDLIQINAVGNKKQVQILKKEDKYKTVWTGKKYDAGTHGTKLLNSIIDVKFPYPKSIHAVEECLEAVIHDKDNCTILDFFGGSGTTAHAVLELNKKDGGNRSFILCTNNENNICEEVTYPRIRNVIEGYKVKKSGSEKVNTFLENMEDNLFLECDDKSSKVKGTGGNLRFFTVGTKKAEQFTEDVKIDSTDNFILTLCLKEDCFDEIASYKFCKIFKNTEDKCLGIICDDDLDSIKFLVKEIKKINKKFVVYIFSYDSYVNSEGFEDVSDLVDLNSYPGFIFDTYGRLLR